MESRLLFFPNSEVRAPALSELILGFAFIVVAIVAFGSQTMMRYQELVTSGPRPTASVQVGRHQMK